MDQKRNLEQLDQHGLQSIFTDHYLELARGGFELRDTPVSEVDKYLGSLDLFSRESAVPGSELEKTIAPKEQAEPALGIVKNLEKTAILSANKMNNQ